MNKKILVVDDEPSISKLIEFHLQTAGFEVQCVFDGEAVFDQLYEFRPDLIVLDLMLPKMDGIAVCRKLREQNNWVPVIMLSALHELSDRVAGLDNGADDYMSKPFSPQELVSRIRSVFRRSDLSPAQENKNCIQLGPLYVDPDQREVQMHHKKLELTPKEFELLLFLCRHRNKVLSRRQLLHGVWDYHFLGDTRIVDVHISHLRDKLEPNPKSPEWITTIRNVGYKLIAPAPDNNSVAHTS